MKFIKQYSGIAALILWCYTFFFAGSTETTGDYITSVGPKLKLRETGSLFKITYNDTDRLTIAKLKSGNITLGNVGSLIMPGAIEATGNITFTGTNNAIDGLNVGTSSGIQKLNVFGGADIQDSIIIGSFCELTEQGNNPKPTASSKTAIYMKADKFIIAYDNAGTMKYRYIDLTGTDATWNYTTTPP